MSENPIEQAEGSAGHTVPEKPLKEAEEVLPEIHFPEEVESAIQRQNRKLKQRLLLSTPDYETGVLCFFHNCRYEVQLWADTSKQRSNQHFTGSPAR